MTHFQTSTFAVAETAIGVVSNLFGGFLNQVNNSTYEVQRAIGGKAHDAALEEAVKEGKTYFHQCGRCGKWVCPDVCWNGDAGMCEGCAPKFEQEMAAAHAQAKVDAARAQLHDKAAKVDYASNVDMSAKAVRQRPGRQPPRPVAAQGAGRRRDAALASCRNAGA